MMQDIRYTLEVEPIIRAYDDMFPLLANCWAANGHKEYFAASKELETKFPNWENISIKYETLDFKRLQSTVLPKDIQYLVPHQKTTSKRILERRKIAGRI